MGLDRRRRIANGEGEYNYARTGIPIAELPGIGVFYKDAAAQQVFHTYSTYARGLDMLNVAYHLSIATCANLQPAGRAVGWAFHNERAGATVAFG